MTFPGWVANGRGAVTTRWNAGNVKRKIVSRLSACWSNWLVLMSVKGKGLYGDGPLRNPPRFPRDKLVGESYLVCRRTSVFRRVFIWHPRTKKPLRASSRRWNNSGKRVIFFFYLIFLTIKYCPLNFFYRRKIIRYYNIYRFGVKTMKIIWFFLLSKRGVHVEFFLFFF